MDVQHYFIFNPAAGAKNAREKLQSQLQKLDGVPYTLLITGRVGDAAKLVREVCEHETGLLRFYACGGDGTLGEVAQGAQGFPNAAVGVWPCGSGNDYARMYGGAERFLDLNRQVMAPTTLVDLIRVNDRMAINVVNLGLEAHAANTMLRFRRHPLLGGKRAYFVGVASALPSGLKTRCTLTVDGQPFFEGVLLTAAFASGQYIGGGFHCAPEAHNDDGLLDLALVLPFPRLKLLKLLPIYKKGEHLNHPAFEGHLRYLKAGRVQIACEKETTLCLDGEIIRGSEFTIEMLPRAVRFILPEIPA